jgi:hypothetical protein
MATKYLHTTAGGSAGAPAASIEKDPPAPVPPATEPTAEKKPPAPVMPAVVANPGTTETTSAKTKARVKTTAIRQGRNATAGQTTGPRPSADSRLGAWDPDSPVPP